MQNILPPEQLQLLGQLTLAVFLGSLIGIERTLAHRLAGFRTFALVSLGACVFTVVSDIAFTNFGMNSAFDPSRIASQIVVGVGFLAGGLIVLNKDQVHGLTTSAGLWVAAGIGMAVGFKLYMIALFVTVLTILIFGLFWQIEQKIVARRHDPKP
jgi:putative Mg2+ transporter-C (MgtC) family protein